MIDALSLIAGLALATALAAGFILWLKEKP